MMGIGAQLGRTEGWEDRFRSFEAVKEMRSAFLQRYGSTSCEQLNHGDFESLEHQARCKEIVLEAVRMAHKIVSQE